MGFKTGLEEDQGERWVVEGGGTNQVGGYSVQRGVLRSTKLRSQCLDPMALTTLVPVGK